MKKMFFTAIAMVAFSGASMANTIETNETKKENLDIKSEEIVTGDYWECANSANSTFMELIEYVSYEEAMSNANADFSDCMGSGCTPPFVC